MNASQTPPEPEHEPEGEREPRAGGFEPSGLVMIFGLIVAAITLGLLLT